MIKFSKANKSLNKFNCIYSANLTIKNGGTVNTSTGNQSSNAGDITVDISESIVIEGFSEDFDGINDGSSIFSNALINNGNGGSINVFTDELTIKNGGIIGASNFDVELLINLVKYGDRL